MKIAIHDRKESYSDRWIEYCKLHSIDYKLVNCYDNDIIHQVSDCDALMWHWPFWDLKAMTFARQLTKALESKGILVYPDIETCWHYDDKIGQKYLLEAIEAPLVPSYVFYDKKTALDWCHKTSFPKVFKLKGGAASVNVKLVKTKREAVKLVRQAFGRGFPAISRWVLFKDRVFKFNKQRNLSTTIGIFKGIARLFVKTDYEIQHQRDKGAIYFQDFIPENHYDIRIYIVGRAAFGLKRYVRKNDFRASGSGLNYFEKDQINLECVKLAFEVAGKLLTQSLACDFIFDKNVPKLVEISYASVQEVYTHCPGYYDEQLRWHEGNFHIEDFILTELIRQIETNKEAIPLLENIPFDNTSINTAR